MNTKPRGGRPALVEGGSPRTVTLTPEVREAAAQLGSGSVSVGIMRAFRERGIFTRGPVGNGVAAEVHAATPQEPEPSGEVL